ncbi:hypothetical protein BD413DRAFT_603407 [Trametes elegans]|nr:hypothetical protein BD413DRAFT_603407 [Trametes elegans]
MPPPPTLTPEEVEASSQARFLWPSANAELGKDYDRAFRLYVKAAEQYLLLGRQTTDDRARTLYRSQAAKSLQRAEKIKAARRDVRPVVKDEYSEGEQLYVLQKSSLVNEGFFPPWDSPERSSSASEQPALSAEQLEQSATWLTPNDDRYRVGTDEPSTELLPQDITQKIVSDCSVCGSIAVCVDHQRRFGSKMIVEAVHPKGDHGAPTRSDSGEYHLRLLYNGCRRRVSIDDKLPTHPDGTLLCMSTGAKKVLWPSLVEKAYMKLTGGYDFLGSALAGWIPEHVDMRSSDFQAEKSWMRIAEGYQSGHCVLTLGTGERVLDTGLPLRLLPAHCYAVIGVHDDGDDRRLTIFDPWVRPTHDDSQDGARMSHGGVHEVSWDTVCNHFDGIYFSWSPELFRHQLTFHGCLLLLFCLCSYAHTHLMSASHFQGQLRLQTSGAEQSVSVWLQLTRHVRSHRSGSSGAEYISLSAQGGGGEGLTANRDVLSTEGQYTNAPHVLVRTTISTDELLTFVASYEGEREDVGFTITAYTNAPATWVHAPARAPYSKDLEGAFTQKSAGGNHTYPSYYLNPQYHLRVLPRAEREVRDAKTALTVTLRGDRHIPMNVTLAWSQGERVNELGHNDLALSSGPYSYGYALASGRVPPGDYTLIVSAFEPRHVGKFALRVQSSDQFELTPVPHEGAGMFSKVVRGAWTDGTAGGGPSFGSYATNPAYEIHVPTASQLQFRLRLAQPRPSASLNLTIFPAPLGSAKGTGAGAGTHVATSGPYSDATAGAVVPQTAFPAGRYLAVPSTYSPGVRAEFVLVLYSSARGVQVSPVRQ